MQHRRRGRSRGSTADRLDSWKEIASFLKRSVRTVQRWEASENLPVRRHVHKSKGTVYAYKDDLEAWLKRRTVHLPAAPAPPTSRPDSSSQAGRPSTPQDLPTTSLEAYRLYLKGRRGLELRTKAGLRHGIECFERAVEHDSTFSLALAGIADCWNMLGFHSFVPPQVAFPKAAAASRDALSLREESAEARTALGFTALFYDWDWAAAAASFQRALQIRPDYAPAHYWYGLNVAALGQPFEAILHLRRAQELDPLSPLVNTYLAGAFYFARQFDEAEAKCRLALEMEPNFPLARLVLGWTFRERLRFDLAEPELRAAAGGSRDSVDGLAALGHCLGVAGRHQEARKILGHLDRIQRTSFVSSGHRAMVLLGLGDHAGSLRELAQAYRERYPWLVFLKLDPVFNPLRTHRAFSELLELVGF